MSHSQIHLEHALVDVTDMAESLPFYQRLFPDWTIRWQGHSRGGHRWLHLGPRSGEQPGYLSLCEVGPTSSSSQSDGVRIEHLGFSHPAVNQLVVDMAVHGVTPSDRMEDESYRRAYFVDPDGHELEFVQKL